MTKEKMISIYDPGINAYREVSVSTAKKFVEASKLVEAELEKLEEA